MKPLVIALPTGRISKQIMPMFQEKRISDKLVNVSRKLQILDKKQNIKFMFLKPSDIITYVENGVADIGFVGKDSLLEEEKDVLELSTLKIGVCKMVVAGFEGTTIFGKEEPLRVATKYPNIARKYFKENRQNITIIKLNGSVEIAPLVGLSDVIVDITETGTSLHENNLVVLSEIKDVSTRLISNRVSYQFKKENIDQLIMQLEEGTQ